jgi:hypothetical protein
VRLRRPDPQALWPKSDAGIWKTAHGTFIREGRDGRWKFSQQVPETWNIKLAELAFHIRPNAFKHTGIFPEQLPNWNWARRVIGQRLAATKGKDKDKAPSVLNLFGYTGGATLAERRLGQGKRATERPRGGTHPVDLRRCEGVRETGTAARQPLRCDHYGSAGLWAWSGRGCVGDREGLPAAYGGLSRLTLGLASFLHRQRVCLGLLAVGLSLQSGAAAPAPRRDTRIGRADTSRTGQQPHAALRDFCAVGQVKPELTG